MTDPAPDAGGDKTTEHANPTTDLVAGDGSDPPAAGDATKDDEVDRPEGVHDGAEGTTEGDSEEEEEEEEDDQEEEEDDEDDEDDDEPRLKYARLTQHLGPVYRNADATSSSLVAGDKMV